jgi:hypothetical protein
MFPLAIDGATDGATNILYADTVFAQTDKPRILSTGNVWLSIRLSEI